MSDWVREMDASAKKAGTIAADKNNWWARANEVNANNWGLAPKAGPSDWLEFRENFGGGQAKQSQYENWRMGQQRERTMADFVNRMATGDLAQNQFSSTMQGDYDAYKGKLNSYLDTPAPVASNVNRFETGLTDAESRLRNLLDNPDSINQSAAYKFRLKQGEDAIQRQLGAKGLLNSGNRLMELTKYGQDMGSQEYDAQAGRLNSLLGNYSQSWLGDKNANTSRYAAESNAWNQRGGVLSDIYGKAQQGVTSAAKIGADQRLGWANAWTAQAPKALQWGLGGNT